MRFLINRLCLDEARLRLDEARLGLDEARLRIGEARLRLDEARLGLDDPLHMIGVDRLCLLDNRQNQRGHGLCASTIGSTLNWDFLAVKTVCPEQFLDPRL